jgi:hypothetical protein
MLQGDALAVQLFIGAAALNVLSVAMTQAGWTHRWFVWGLFGLSALLATLSITWGHVETAIPSLNTFLSVLASSRITWVFAGIIPAFILGARLHGSVRERRRKEEWVPAYVAAMEFTKPHLIANLHSYETQLADLTEEWIALNEKLKNSKKTPDFIPLKTADRVKGEEYEAWPAPGSEDTELGVLMEPEVGHGEAEVYTRVQA